MTSGHEPVLHALFVEPRVAHPGDAVSIVFRTRNFGSAASPAGTVHFILPGGLEPVAESDVRAPVAPVAPGADVTAQIVVHVRAPIDDGTPLMLQAALEADGALYGTNVCTVVACSRPVLDGPHSGVFVESIDSQTVRVRAVVTNEGDGPACDVRLVVPAPLGTAPCDDRSHPSDECSPQTRSYARIDSGETVTVAFDARIVAPIGVVCADGAYTEAADGRRRSLPARAEVELSADVAEPEVVLRAERRRLRIAVAVRNDGWGDARDVRIGVTLPPVLRVQPESVLVDDAPLPQRSGRRNAAVSSFARVERAGATTTIVLDRVAARSTTRLECAASGTTARVDGDAEISLTTDGVEHTLVVPFALEPVRDVRARIVGSPRSVSPGAVAALVIELVNRGDVAETLDVAVVGDCESERVPSLTLEPGHAALATLVLRVPSGIAAERPLRVGVLCSDASGERARVDAAIAVLERPRHEPRATSAQTPHAHDPVERRRAAGCDDVAPVRGRLTVPQSAASGAPFIVRASIEVDDPLDVLVLHASADPVARYVAGSTTLDGRIVLDRDRTSPLHGDGLPLRGVPAGTKLSVTWSLIADAGSAEELHVAARCVADGTAVGFQSVAIAVRPGDAFPVRPAGLSYHVDAQTPFLEAEPAQIRASSHGAVALRAAEMEVLTRPESAPTAAPQRPAERVYQREEPVWIIRLDDVRAASLERAMRPGAGNTLVSHVLALRSLVPDLAPADDHGDLARALAGLRDAVHDVFDRLSVKLRIPGFTVAGSDLEDPAMRRALTALLALLDVSAMPPPMHVSARAELGHAPFGAPSALRALVALVPSRCDAQPSLADALRRYAGTLDAALVAFDGVALPFFEDALMRDAGSELAEARAAVATHVRRTRALVGAA